MPIAYNRTQAQTLDNPSFPLVQGAAKREVLSDHPGAGATIPGNATPLSGVLMPHIDWPTRTQFQPLLGPRDAVASVRAQSERNYPQIQSDERRRATNCGGTIGNGNCGAYPGGVFFDTPDGNWWNTPYAYIGNPSSYDGVGGWSVGYSPNGTWAANGGQIIGTRTFMEARDHNDAYETPWWNCNCGGNNCYTNCNCNCACACDCGGRC